MDEQGFRRFLKRSGKKDHVVEGLIGQVKQFAEFLARERGKGLADAEAPDLESYVAAVEAAQPGSASKQVRGLAYYFGFAGQPELASLAGAIREQETAKARKVFALKDFRGVNVEHIARLGDAGIANVEHMLAAGSTPQARQRLAAETGVPVEAILELVKLADLSRLGGLKGIRARLYYEAGADTPDKIATWEPEALLAMLADFVRRTGFQGIAPLPKEVQNAVAKARALPRLVEYE